MPNKMLFALSKKHVLPVDELEKKWVHQREIWAKKKLVSSSFC